MNIPRAYSDPGAPRLHTIWKHPFPPLPDNAVRPIPSYHGSTSGHSNKSRYHGRTSRMPQVQSRGIGSDIACLETRSFGVNVPSGLSVELEPAPRRRNCLLRILMFPCDLLEALIRKWCEPNERCIHCLKVTYWIVLIVGGICSAILTLAPLLR